MELKELVGPHVLTFVDFASKFEAFDANVVYFGLDGVAYCASEDPEDRYRSCMGDVEVVNDYKPQNIFAPHAVQCRMRDNVHDDVLEVVDSVTERVVLAIGTC